MNSAIIKVQSLTSPAGPIEYKIITKLDGSTGPRHITRVSDGSHFVLKAPIDASGHELTSRNAHEANEYLAFQLYRAAGVRIPEGIELVKVLIEGKDVIGVLENFINGETLYNLMNLDDEKLRELTFPAIRNDLVIHALLANWDINITANIMVERETGANAELPYDYNNPITIDCGGTLQFSAMGRIKEYGPVVTNVESIVRHSRPYKPMGALMRMSKPELKAEICGRWATVDKRAVMDAFVSTKGIIAPYFAAAGLSVDSLGETLTARMAHFDALCGVAAAAVAANKGGGYRSRRRSRFRRRKGTRRVRR